MSPTARTITGALSAAGVLALLFSAGVWYCSSWRPRQIESLGDIDLLMVDEPQRSYRGASTVMAITDRVTLDAVANILNSERSGWHPIGTKHAPYPDFSLVVTGASHVPRRFNIGDHWLEERWLMKTDPTGLTELVKTVQSAPEGARCPLPLQAWNRSSLAPNVPTWPEARNPSRWCSTSGSQAIVLIAECGSIATVIVAHQEAEGYDAFYYRENPGQPIGIKRGATTMNMTCSGDLPNLHGPCNQIARMDCGATDGGVAPKR